MAFFQLLLRQRKITVDNDAGPSEFAIRQPVLGPRAPDPEAVIRHPLGTPSPPSGVVERLICETGTRLLRSAAYLSAQARHDFQKEEG